jgi:hypothetical protein
MTVQFWPCPGCSRHVKRGDALCPFCGATASVESGPTRILAGGLSRAALFAAGAVGAAVATMDCGGPPASVVFYGAISPPLELGDSGASNAGPGLVIGDGGLSTNETDSGVSDGPSEGAADAGDASATTVPPRDSSSASDAPSTTDGPADAGDASTSKGPTDSSSAADVPMAVPFYGAAVIPDE